MTGDIRKHLEISPFVPFAVRTADGREYAVPTSLPFASELWVRDEDYQQATRLLAARRSDS